MSIIYLFNRIETVSRWWLRRGREVLEGMDGRVECLKVVRGFPRGRVRQQEGHVLGLDFCGDEAGLTQDPLDHGDEVVGVARDTGISVLVHLEGSEALLDRNWGSGRCGLTGAGSRYSRKPTSLNSSLNSSRYNSAKSSLTKWETFLSLLAIQ